MKSAKGTAITSTGWRVTPVGRQVTLGERPYGVTLSPDGRTLLVSNDGVQEQSLMVLDAREGAIRQTLSYDAPKALFLGVAFSPDGRRAYASAGQNDEIRAYSVQDGRLTEGDPIPLGVTHEGDVAVHPFPAGLAVSPDGETIYAADHLGNALSIVDAATRHETRVALLGRACVIGPLGDPSHGRDCLFSSAVAVSPDGTKVYVANLGQNTVSVVDARMRTLVKTVTVGTHPSALAFDPAGRRLFVANARATVCR